MKKTLFLSMIIASAMICSCQKQGDALAEAQLAQRKTELDVREETLIQREKAVDEREKAVAEREKAVADQRIIQPQRQAPDTSQAVADERIIQSQRQAPGAAQGDADIQRRIQQLPPEVQALIIDGSQVKAGKAEHNPTTQQPQGVRTQPGGNAEMKKKMISQMAASQPQVPDVNATSPFPSPTPQ